MTNKSFQKVVMFRHLGTTLIKQNFITGEIKSRLQLHTGDATILSRVFFLPVSSQKSKIQTIQNHSFTFYLYGCETSLTLKEEHRLRVFKNEVLRRICEPTGGGEWQEKTA
jgi:hypothetical protein